jgi:hypothetical protein
MENRQVSRARFGASVAMLEPNLHRAATVELRANTDEQSSDPQSGAVPSPAMSDAHPAGGACTQNG